MGSEVEKKKIVIFYHFMLRCQIGWTACLTCGLTCLGMVGRVFLGTRPAPNETEFKFNK